MARTGVQQDALDSLTAAGAFDCFDPRHQSSSEEPADRRSLRWEIGLRYRPVGQQLAFELPVAQDMVALREESEWEQMMGEYGSMGVYPTGHIMKLLRSRLPGYVERSDNLRTYSEGADVTVAGLVIRRQRPSGKATFITLEDEFGHSPLVIWPTIYKRIRRQTTSAVLMARGKVSKREGTLNIVVDDAWAVPTQAPNLKTKDWG
jgi:error-prone DNA polymerase